MKITMKKPTHLGIKSSPKIQTHQLLQKMAWVFLGPYKFMDFAWVFSVDVCLKQYVLNPPILGGRFLFHVFHPHRKSKSKKPYTEKMTNGYCLGVSLPPTNS